MSGFWKLYDELIEGTDPEIRVDEVICGQTWTALKNDAGGVGISMTTPGETRPRTGIDYKGMRLREAAELLKSWNFLEASIGMAAVNSFYNTEERLENSGWEQRDRRFCTFDLSLGGKTVGMVGHLRHNGEIFKDVSRLYIMEMNPLEGDYPASACEELIPECDIVLITGSAFTNKTLPRLLELAKKAFTIITGPSTPMSEAFLREFDVQRMAGFIPTEKDLLWKLVAAGCNKPPYEYGKRFYIDK